MFRLLANLIIFISIAICSFAQESQFFIIDDFSKLLNSHKSPYLTQKDAVDVLNVRANDQYGALSKRPVLNLIGACHSSAVTSLHRYYKSDATKYTIGTSSTYIDYISDTGTCATLDSTVTSGKTWSWITYKDLAIGMNGYDRAVKWDGKTASTSNTDSTRTSGDLVAELGAPFAELNTGSNLTASKWYQYKVAYFDGTNYSYSSARSNPILTGATVRDIYLTDIPLGPAGTTQRIIYRTTGNASKAAVLADTAYKRVATISDNSTRVYADTMTDATLASDTSPTWATVSGGINATPPYGKLSFLHKERLWAANDPSGTTYGKSTVYFSELLNPDYWLTGSNYFLVRPDDGDEVTFIKSYLGELTIGKNNSISKILTNSTSTVNWVLTQPISFIGCLAPYSAVSTPVGIIYLGKGGIYKFNGQFSQLISDVVTKDINDINPTGNSSIASIYFNNEYRMAYSSSALSQGINNRVLIYDFIRDSYTKDSEKIASWAILDSSDDFNQLFSGSSDTDGKIMSHSSVPNNLTYRYQSELNLGTVDSVVVAGDETSPTMEIGWGITIDSVTMAAVTLDSTVYSSAIIDRPTTTGYWYSPIVQINANSLQKLYWNQDLGTAGSVSFAVRSASSQGAVSSASWSSEFTNPSGSDLSALTANTWIQLRAKLSTTDITLTPTLLIEDNFMIKLAYNTTGSNGETTFLSMWESGWIPLDDSRPQNPKLVQEVDVFYEGTAGTVNIEIKNLKGDVVGDFDIDLSKNRLDTQQYFGSGNSKVYRYNTPSVPTAENYLFGDKFKITVTENGTTNWKIQRLVLRYATQQYTPYR